jgi:taspase (threonine aspartase 1)
MLVAQGARAFAVSNGIPVCDPAALAAPRCIAEWEYWKTFVGSPPSVQSDDLRAAVPMQDTVGAISWDSNGKLASGVSRFVIPLPTSCAHPSCSGGLLLKHPGRIGEVRK